LVLARTFAGALMSAHRPHWLETGHGLQLRRGPQRTIRNH
jgi:hypothetical protein